MKKARSTSPCCGQWSSTPLPEGPTVGSLYPDPQAELGVPSNAHLLARLPSGQWCSQPQWQKCVLWRKVFRVSASPRQAAGSSQQGGNCPSREVPLVPHLRCHFPSYGLINSLPRLHKPNPGVLLCFISCAPVLDRQLQTCVCDCYWCSNCLQIFPWWAGHSLCSCITPSSTVSHIISMQNIQTRWMILLVLSMPWGFLGLSADTLLTHLALTLQAGYETTVYLEEV